MANQYGIDLGEVYRTSEAIKGARTQNRLNDIRLNETEREIAQRPARQNMLNQARSGAVSGNESAQQQLLVLDPEGGPKFLEAVSKMDQRRLDNTKKIIDETGRLSAYVLQGNNEEEKQRRYQIMYKGVSPEIQKTLPSEYNQQFLELSMAKATAMDKILESPKSIRLGDQDILYKGGKEIERADIPQKDGSGGGIGSLKSADESLMYRQSAELLGGIFDQQGNITNLDPMVRSKIQAIATRATNIFKEKGNVTRSEAVKMAAKEYGVEIPDIQGSQEISEGAIAKDGKGNVIVFKGGKWVDQFGTPVQ